MSNKKIIRGKRPEFYETPGLDYLMQMVMVLSQELSATRDRLDTIERLAEEKGLYTQADIEAFQPDQEALEFRESNRQQFLSNFFSVITQEAAEVANQDTNARFKEVIEELATEK